MPGFPNVPAFELAPDWACEIVSPCDGALRWRPQARGLRAGEVGRVWIGDPVARTLEALELAGPSWSIAAVHGEDEKVRVAPFSAVELSLAGWWPPSERATAP